MSLRHDRLALLDRYLRIATISRQVTPEMVGAVRGFWHDLGLELVTLAPADGRGTPALYGELGGPSDAPTLLLYGHYDVQPTGDLARWQWQGVKCEPFVPAYFFDGAAVNPRALDDKALDGVVLVAGRRRQQGPAPGERPRRAAPLLSADRALPVDRLVATDVSRPAQREAAPKRFSTMRRQRVFREQP